MQINESYSNTIQILRQNQLVVMTRHNIKSHLNSSGLCMYGIYIEPIDKRTCFLRNNAITETVELGQPSDYIDG